MSKFFNIDGELIVATAHIYGPNSNTSVRLALDTGSVGTVVHPDVLTALVLSRITALDQEREDFPITCHALPSTTDVEGLLGLDFYRQRRRLVVDFHAGEVTLE